MAICAICPKTIPNSLPGSDIKAIFRKQTGNNYWTQHEVCDECRQKEQADLEATKFIQNTIKGIETQQARLDTSTERDVILWQLYNEVIPKLDLIKRAFHHRRLQPK